MRREPTHVYLAQRGRFTKIGVSCNPEQRVKQLPNPCRKGSKARLVVIGIWYCADCSLLVEGCIKNEFRAYRALGYEWFDRTPDQIMPSLEKLLRTVERILERRKQTLLSQQAA